MAKRSLVEQIVDVLSAHGFEWPGGAANAELRRTYAGHWQRSAGAWSWYLRTKDGTTGLEVGAHYPATEVLAKKMTPYVDHHGDICFEEPSNTHRPE